MLVQKQLEFRHVLYTFKLNCKIRLLTFNFKAKKTSTLLLHLKSIILIFVPVLNISKTDRGILVAPYKTTMLTPYMYCLNIQLTHSSPPTLHTVTLIAKTHTHRTSSLTRGSCMCNMHLQVKAVLHKICLTATDSLSDSKSAFQDIFFSLTHYTNTHTLTYVQMYK
jgi:hypothetical protein